MAAHGVSVSISLLPFPVALDFGRGWSWASVPSPLFVFFSLQLQALMERPQVSFGSWLPLTRCGDTFGGRTGEYLRWVSLDGRKHSLFDSVPVSLAGNSTLALRSSLPLVIFEGVLDHIQPPFGF